MLWSIRPIYSPRLLQIRRFALVLTLALGGYPYELKADALYLGASVMDFGDEIYRPGLNLNGEINNNRLNLLYTGRSFEEVHENTGVISVARILKPHPDWAWLKPSLGLSVIDQYIKINAGDSVDKHSINVGISLGFGAQFPLSKLVSLDLAWDLHYFPAGTAIIFLTTGRVHALSLKLGLLL